MWLLYNGLNMYGDWFTKGTLTEMTGFRELNKTKLNILRFLAESGSHSTYDVAKKLTHKYPHVYSSVKNLEEQRFIKSEKDPSSSRRRKLLKLQMTGMIVFIVHWKDHRAEFIDSMEKSIHAHEELFPFSRQWSEIGGIVGNNAAVKKLAPIAWDLCDAREVTVEVDEPKLKFDAWVGRFVGRMFFRNEVTFEGKERDKNFADFLGEHDELRNAYIAYLAVEDILDLDRRVLRIEHPKEFRSEKELAFFEKRDVGDNLLSREGRLKEIFPKYTSLKYAFTGRFMYELMWRKEVKKPIKKRRFRVHFP